MSNLTPLPFIRARFFDANGLPLAGGLVYTYVAGTSTPMVTYNDSTGVSPNTNPVVLDAQGQADIWFSGALKINVTDSLGASQPGYPVDNITDIGSFVTGNTQWLATNVTPTYINATQFSVPGDMHLTFTPGTRLQLVTTGGTIYGITTGASYGSGVTTVTVILDSGSLTGISSVATGIITVLNPSIAVSATPTANFFAKFDAASRMNTNSPAFEATMSGDQTLSTATWTKVVFNTKTFDTNGNYDAVTNYRFTPTVAGKYLISGNVLLSYATSLNNWYVAVYKNGAIYRIIEMPVVTGAFASVPFSLLIDFNGSTDYIEIYAYIQGTGTLLVKQKDVSNQALGSWVSGVRSSI